MDIPEGEEDGTVIWVSETVRIARGAETPIALIACEDITERRNVEDALRAAVEGVATQTGEDFFSSLVRCLATVFKVQYAYLSEMNAEGMAPPFPRSLGAWSLPPAVCGAGRRPLAKPS